LKIRDQRLARKIDATSPEIAKNARPDLRVTETGTGWLGMQDSNLQM
jgi:hypothetical protein